MRQEGVAPEGLCSCEASLETFENCSSISHVKTLYNGVPTAVLSGNITPPVETANDVSFVRFTELYTYVGRSDLRLLNLLQASSQMILRTIHLPLEDQRRLWDE